MHTEYPFAVWAFLYLQRVGDTVCCGGVVFSLQRFLSYCKTEHGL